MGTFIGPPPLMGDFLRNMALPAVVGNCRAMLRARPSPATWPRGFGCRQPGGSMKRARRFLTFASIVLTACALSGAALAQSYPSRPVKIIVPIGPAGSYDIVGRLVADQLSRRLGQTVVVENRPGAGAIIGTQAVATSPPDGYTLLIGGLANMVFNAGLYK